MVGKREQARKDLTERVLKAATARIEQSGLSGLRARDVASDAGCALGSIYTCFEDFEDLIFRVNSGTMKKLGAALDEELSGAGSRGHALEALALGYARFARENRNLWWALFEHRPSDGPPPDWVMEEHQGLLHKIVAVMCAAEPDLSPDQASIRARTYFSAVHGVVSISLQEVFVGVPVDALEDELKALVTKL